MDNPYPSALPPGSLSDCPALNDDMQQLEQQLQQTAAHSHHLEHELSQLRWQLQGLPEKISGLNARLAMLEAAPTEAAQQQALKQALSEKLNRIAHQYHSLAAQERDIQRQQLRVRSTLGQLEHALKVGRIKTGHEPPARHRR